MVDRRNRSLRARITAAAAAVVGVALVGGSLAFYATFSVSVRDVTTRSAEARAEELAVRVEERGSDEVAALEDEIAQVLDRSGRVIASSEDADEGGLRCTDPPSIINYDEDSVLVVCEDLDDGTTLAVGVPVDHDQAAMGTVAALLVLSVLVVVPLVAIVVWWVVGRALRPVSSIRAEVDRITADRLHRRVPVPSSGDEIAALAGTMNRMLDRLDAAATAQRRFISDASHELRSPLATIRQHAELARLHPEASSVSELAHVVFDEGLRIQGLVDSLLLLTRLDEQAPIHREQVDMDDIALAEAARLRASGVTVDTSGVAAARVRGDGRLLSQLARNLADNAARHAHTCVAISVAARDGRAYLAVDDDGDGIVEQERDRVFERFVRLDEGRDRDSGGSGLGLAIVRGIAEAEGGTVRAETSPLGGARFLVVLPAAT